MNKDEDIYCQEEAKASRNYNQICWEAAVNVVINKIPRDTAYEAAKEKYFLRLDSGDKEKISCDGNVEYLTEELNFTDYPKDKQLQIQKVKDAIYEENERDIDKFNL